MGRHRRLRAADFDYAYTPELVAQRPLDDRAASRLLVVHRDTGGIAHKRFRDFPSLLEPGDVLVRNVSRVIPARLTATRDNGRPAEVLLVHPEPDGTWIAMVHPGGKLKTGRRVTFGDVAEGEITDVVGGGLRRVRFSGLPVEQIMERFGSVPLPHYIERPPETADRERYQTVYAREAGSVAAPTAGLHFTEQILGAVRERGVAIVDVTLHVGPGTFKPVEVEDPGEHVMHAEWYEVPAETIEAIRHGKQNGGRVWAVGTTAARVMETIADRDDCRSVIDRERGDDQPVSGWTDQFIYPPYEFQVVDGLLTNFHLPRSTLIMLVAAFAGYDNTMRAYGEAVEQRYRLFSYGDAMVVL
jgi:S-adenosylmethionine:tRNA ribosyltransferase-isomerase